MIEAVVFDLDGVIVDSEQVWDEVRAAYARETGGHYGPSAARDMMGMSSPEWSRYMADELGVPGTPQEINAAGRRAHAQPLRGGAAADSAARSTPSAQSRERWPVAIASSSNRELIDVVARAPRGCPMSCGDAVSSEEVARGKPAPDVYLEAARRLGVDAAACAAVEDSHNGIRSAKAAGMRVVAIPNPHFPPGRSLSRRPTSCWRRSPSSRALRG